MNVRLVHGAQLRQFHPCFCGASQLQSRLRQRVPKHVKVCVGEPFRSLRIVARIHHLRQINRRVPRHGKSQARLTGMNPFDAHNHQRSHVQHRHQRSQPGLIAVLRTKETQDGIGKAALQQFTRPALPVAQNLIENGLLNRRILRASGQPHQQFGCGRGRSRAGIEHRNLNFPP